MKFCTNREIRKPPRFNKNVDINAAQFGGGVLMSHSCVSHIVDRLDNKSWFLYDYRHFLWMHLANHEILR